MDLSNFQWTVRAVGDLSGVPASVPRSVLPARVPGCVHSDLMRAGLIGDPRAGFNERECQWIGETDWDYRTSFELTERRLEHDRLDLVCECLDCIAELMLNGAAIGNAANAFHPHRFDIREAARTGSNELAIVFRSPLRHVRAEGARLGARPYNGDSLGWAPFPFIRKSACNFGWDWAPRVATCGVGAPIRIEAWSGVRLAGVRRQVRQVDDSRWSVDASIDLEWSGTGHMAEGPLLEGGIAVHHRMDAWGGCELELGQTTAALSASVDRPPLWQPRGHGDQALYGHDIVLAHQGPRPFVQGSRGMIGFRDVHLNTEPDEHGERFQIEVNGKPVFCKGANWVPEGLFPEDRTPERIRERVRQAAAANMNMLRVWGGGIYESDAFYDECDRLGIMVWQDFMFACACYPEEPPYPALVEAEARHQIARLSSHPSVVLWCGGNECVWGYESWGNASGEATWKERVGTTTWGASYYFDLLPRLLNELDPSRPYWANSPWSGRKGESPNQEMRGDRHAWDAMPGSAAFREIAPRFCSEFGRQSPPNLEALRRVLKPQDMVLGSEASLHRQRATGGMAKHIDGPMLERFPKPNTFEEWYRLAQELQAHDLKDAIEWYVSNRPRCMGALIWQLNDAWPGMSWSLIDSDGRPKPAYYAVREAFGRITP